MRKTSHFHSHPPLFLDFWDCVALGHFSLDVHSCVVFSCCFRARTRCPREVLIWVLVGHTAWPLGERCVEFSWEDDVGNGEYVSLRTQLKR